MRKRWTIEEDEIIKAEYPFVESCVLAVKLNCPLHSLYDRANRLGIRKDPLYFETHNAGRLRGDKGKDCRFKKGSVPWNKGMKGLCFSPGTTFKKGNVPYTYRPIGSLQLREDGYIFIKVADPKTWVQLHRLVWESEYGPIPDGKIVKFRDKDRMNFDISNLYLADRKEHMAENTFARYPADLRAAIKTLKKLTKTIEEYGTQQN
jgi:hypothetical protein